VIDDPKMTFVASCRLNDATLFFFERFALNFADAEVVVDENGRIPVFPSEEIARAELARRFPLPRGTPLTERSSVEELAAAMEDEYSAHMKPSYDLDAARTWAQAPGPSGLTPSQALEVWELCWQVGEAPRPQRFDPMGMYAMLENMMRDQGQRDFYETVLLGMKLSGIVILAQEGRAPPDWEAEFPDLAELWPKTDYARLAGILEQGVAGFARRVLPES
jgi:hypothetical protein